MGVYLPEKLSRLSPKSLYLHTGSATSFAFYVKEIGFVT
jgi:hypothetical protein